MQISRWIASAATAVMLAISAGSLSAQAQEKLKIATEGAYPPFNTITADGKLVGFDVDITNALCAQMKVECELVTQDWDG
ncbi:MAG: transporter substrate-binding domain-containing protein, partial [Mesorhizobium sp.]